MADELDLFMSEMEGVTPLKKTDKADVGKVLESDVAALERRRLATAEKQHDRNFLSEDYVEMLDAFYILDFKRDGVQNGVYRKLKLGKYPIEQRIDLHRMTVKRARQVVFEFVEQCVENDVRNILIVHGKGLNQRLNERVAPSPDDKAILKSYLNKWLQELPQVMAFHSAQQPHGGAGAVYVLLRKSERKKEENRRRFIAGRDKYGPDIKL
ncbi:MAG TPA: DNA endonuclease SmrA [Pseudomonadales bacterium]|nr:DNA endonuclease SmrA [Pseudomonadales bacterium]